MRRLVAFTALVLALYGCGSEKKVGPSLVDPVPTTAFSSTSTMPPDLPTLVGLELELLAELVEPVAIASAPGVAATFVVERAGRVVQLADPEPVVVLDITAQVSSENSEQGFLGMMPHPDFPTDPRVFAIYTDLHEDVVAASFVWVDGAFDPASEIQILQVDQPHFYHQGGGMAFGPQGFLWMSFGDGGGIGDRFKNGQDTDTLNGTVVRISVDDGSPYAVPSTNPFASNEDGAPEIWAYGLRNPWRITIDGDVIIIADVAQDGFEEVNVSKIARVGHNFGWPVLEGTECYDAETCDSTGMTPPVLTVDPDEVCAIIGGPVYRGSQIPELYGHYVFGDLCRGWMRSAPLTGDDLGEVVDWEPMLGSIGTITTFGLDPEGELLVATIDGSLYRIVARR